MVGRIRTRRCRTVFFVLALLALAGCTRGCPLQLLVPYREANGTVFSWRTLPVFPPGTVAKAKVKESYFAVAAKRKASDAVGFTRVPFDLWAPFAFSLRFGVFRPDLAAGLGDGIFGVELDARVSETGAKAAPVLEFYGFYAQFVQGGLNTFVSKRGPGDAAATNVGQHFFPATTRVDVSVAHDGANLVFTARPAGTAQAPVQVASIAFAQGAPLNPAVGAFGIGNGGQVGFSRFELLRNGSPPAPVSPAEAAVNDLVLAAASILHAHNLLDGTAAPDTAGAAAALGESLLRLETARASVTTAFAASKDATPLGASLRQLQRAAVAVTLAQEILLRTHVEFEAARRFLECRALVALFLCLDLILPPPLRGILAGEPPLPAKRPGPLAPRVAAPPPP